MVELKQEKPFTVKILGGFLLLLVAFLVGSGHGMPLSQLLTMGGLGLLLLGYSVSYEIYSDYNNKRCFKLFGLPLFKSDLKIEFPDYISLFSARVGKGSDWGPIAAMGGSAGSQRYTVRMFRGRQHFTLYRSSKLEKAQEKSEALASLLKVPVKEKIG
ncbi:hypothetical protein [Pseudozobellia thermophila]|uniref:PH domain-containing protein n=1 Tax=Pseudozobellia thermophila TaxID=192903 RepID=A0A1M6BJU0_9FLAO|nr:hypothetical protein [Pseudozobellia thermophila]SHI48858.1 hypothetical protein SAMN04488513_101444 [Pseudozobellia thermophila]